MRITWFGHEAFRIQAEKCIYAVYPQTCAPKFESREITSGADRVIESGKDVTVFNAQAHLDRSAPLRFIESEEAADSQEKEQVFRLGDAGFVFLGEPETPMVLLTDLNTLELSAIPAGLGQSAFVLVGEDTQIVETVLGINNIYGAQKFLLGCAELSEESWEKLRQAPQGIQIQLLDVGYSVEI